MLMKRIIRDNLFYGVPLFILFVINIFLADSYSGRMGWICSVVLVVGFCLTNIMYEKRIKDINDAVAKFYEEYKERDDAKEKKN